MSTLEGGFPILSPRFDRVASRWSSLVTVWTDFVGTGTDFAMLGMLGIGSNVFDEVWWIFFSFFDEIEIEILLIAEGKYCTSRVLSFFVPFKIVSNGSFKLNSWSMCSIRNRIVNLIYFEIIGTGKLNSALKDIEILLIEKDDLF